MQGPRHELNQEPNQETIPDHSPNGFSNYDPFAVRIYYEYLLFK